MPRCTCWRLSHMLRLYVCNVIKVGMSKWAKLVQILVNDKCFKMPFLRGTHLPVAHRICQVVSNIRKLDWLKLSKRLVSKRQMLMPIFSWQRTWHIKVWKMVGGTCPHWDFRGSLFVSGTILKQSQRSRPVSREHANDFLSIVRHTNAEKRYHQCGQLTHFHCTIVRRDPPHLAGSYMSYVSPANVWKA